MSGFRIGRLAGSVALTGLIVAGTLGCQATPSAPTQAPAKQSAPTQAPAAAPTQATAPAATQAPAAAAPTQAPAAAATQAPAAAAQVIKLGLNLATTGAFMRTGQAQERFIRMAIDDVNAKGINVGGKAYRFEADTAENNGTVDEAKLAAERFVMRDKTMLVMGTGSGPTAGAQQVTEANKALMFAGFALDASLGTKYPLTIQAGRTNLMVTPAEYQWLHQEHPEVKTIGILSTDDAVGQQNAKQGEENAKANGITVAAKELYPLDLKDYDPVITRLLRQKPDAIDAGGLARGPAMLAITKSLSQQGFKGVVIANAVDVTAMAQAVSWAEGFTVGQMVDYTSDAVLSGERAIIERYNQKYGKDSLETIVTIGSLYPTILAQAMEKAGTVTDIPKIVDTIRNGEFDTMWSKEFGKTKFVGAKTYGLNVIPEQPIYLSGIRNGKVVTFKAMKGTLP